MIGAVIFVNPISKVVRPIWFGMKMLIFVGLLVKAIVSNQIRIPKLLKVTQIVKLSWLAVHVLLVSLFDSA